LQRTTWFLPLVLAATALGFIAFFPLRLASSTAQSLKVSFSLEKEAITLHEPVLVRLRADNSSERPLRLDMGFDRVGNLRFFIARPGERPVEITPRLHPGIVRAGLVTVAPGGSYTLDILLNELYTFSAKGSYIIQVSLTTHGTAAPEGQATAYKSQKMYLRVLPRNPPQLRQACEGLMGKIMSSSAEASMESTKALSYVNDLVAVPYLEQAATRGPFKPVVRPMAIDGLSRISLTSGKNKVFSLLTQKDPRIEAEISLHMATITNRTEVSPP
jgi:hypothetical protein